MIKINSKFHSQIILDNFDEILRASLPNRHLIHSDIKSIIKKLLNDEKISVFSEAVSIENREIYCIKVGNGNKKVLMWTQMHGDESTGTKAVFDLIEILSGNKFDGNNFSAILNEITLYIIPMLNPDGAGKFIRENAAGIDLNRDALRLVSPESLFLNKMFEVIKPDFAFNLHDQNIRTTAGNKRNPATLSLLAPPYDSARHFNRDRKTALRIIANIIEEMFKYIPKNIAKYEDEHEPRSFGDNFAGKGCSTILLEAGGFFNDPDKEYTRKMYTTALFTGIESIAGEVYDMTPDEIYDLIPENGSRLFDLLLRNLRLTVNGKIHRIDVGINRYKKYSVETDEFYFDSEIVQIGDLSIFHAFEEHDFNGFEIFPAETELFKGDFKKLTESDCFEKLKLGIGFLQFEKPFNCGQYSGIPMNIVFNENCEKKSITKGNPANFKIVKEGKTAYMIINGYLIDFSAEKNYVQNGMVIH